MREFAEFSGWFGGAMIAMVALLTVGAALGYSIGLDKSKRLRCEDTGMEWIDAGHVRICHERGLTVIVKQGEAH